MKILFNKKSIISIIVILALVNIVGCSKENKTSNSNSTTTTTINNSVSNASNSSNNGTNSVTSNTSGNSSKPLSEESQQSQNLLDSIIAAAKDGKVINCDFAVKDTNTDNVKEQWGNPDSSQWVTAAKGMYSTYSKYNIVFGANKGNQVFEVRSLDNKLNSIHLSVIKEKLGTPQYDVKANGEEIVGYKITDEFKVLFVFPEGAADPALSHYSVLYPAGTINNMAGDKGREW